MVEDCGSLDCGLRIADCNESIRDELIPTGDFIMQRILLPTVCLAAACSVFWQSAIRNPQSAVRNQESAIRNPRPAEARNYSYGEHQAEHRSGRNRRAGARPENRTDHQRTESRRF